MTDIKTLKKQVQKEIKTAKNLKELDQIFKKFLGRKGKLTRILRSLKEFKGDKRVKVGKEANSLKEFIEKKIEEEIKRLQKKSRTLTFKKEWIDVTRPGKKITFGHLHPLTQVQREVEEIFQSMGFLIVEGPEIETELYNFDVLNIPQEHPARDVWDTLWLKGEKRLLLRTHTSPVQVRYMEKHNPPLRIIVPGRVFGTKLPMPPMK